MTYYPAHGWRAGPAPVAGRRSTALDFITAGLAVFIVLTFSQGWIRPLMGEAADPATSGAIRAMYFPAYGAGLLLLALSAGDVARVLIRQPLLIVLMGIVAASTVWSIEPDQTLRRVVAVGFTTLAGVALAARFSWAQLIEILAIAFAILCVVSFLAGIAVPSIGRMPAGSEFPGAWRGVWAEKNALGVNMALYMPAFIAAAIYQPRRRMVWGGVALLCLTLLLLSTAKTSLVAMALGVCGVLFVALVRRGPAMAVIATYLAVLAVLGGAAIFLFAPSLVFDLLGKDATLTGRTEIWSAIMIQVKARPLLGYGYGTVWTDQLPWTPLAWIIKDAGFRAYHAHSSWYEQLLSMGYVGLTGWALFYAQTMIAGVVATYRQKGAFLAFPILLTYSMISLTESITLTYNDLDWVLFVAIACKVAFPDKAMR